MRPQQPEPAIVVQAGAVKPPGRNQAGCPPGNSLQGLQEAIPPTLIPPLSPVTLLMGERDRRLHELRPEEVDYIEADGNYVKFHVAGMEYITRASVKRLAATLAHAGFVRIERSLLVNLNAISHVQRIGRGTFAFTLISGTRLRSGATYREQLLQVLPL
jgi:two-component system, LytTR family, response regulator